MPELLMPELLMPDLQMEAAEWWIKTHALDHFEKDDKIRDMIAAGK